LGRPIRGSFHIATGADEMIFATSESSSNNYFKIDLTDGSITKSLTLTGSAVHEAHFAQTGASPDGTVLYPLQIESAGEHHVCKVDFTEVAGTKDCLRAAAGSGFEASMAVGLDTNRVIVYGSTSDVASLKLFDFSGNTITWSFSISNDVAKHGFLTISADASFTYMYTIDTTNSKLIIMKLSSGSGYLHDNTLNTTLMLHTKSTYPPMEE
jgi:hypothetical protein